MDEFLSRLEYLKRLVAHNADTLPKIRRVIDRLPEGSKKKEILQRQYEALGNYTNELQKIIDDMEGGQ